MAYTAEQKLDLRTVIKDYRDALLAEDNDKIADTAEVLDTTLACITEGREYNDLEIDVICTYAEENDFVAAAAILAEALEQLA